jgi:hypothetical protein
LRSILDAVAESMPYRKALHVTAGTLANDYIYPGAGVSLWRQAARSA